MIQSSCYNCKDRYVGCHSKCDRYKEFKIKKAEENESIRKSKLIEGDHYAVLKHKFKKTESIKG